MAIRAFSPGLAKAVSGVLPLLDNNQAVLATTTLYITVPAGNVLEVCWGDGTATTVVCDGALKTLTKNYAATGTYQIGVRGNYKAITDWYSINQAFLSGDVARFAPLTALTVLALNATGVTGNIASLAGLILMEDINLSSTLVTGDIVILAGMTGMRQIRLHLSGVFGNIASLAGLTAVNVLWCSDTGVSGDLAALAPLTSLVILSLYNTNITYTAGAALPAWAGCDIRIYDTGLTNVADTWMVDNFLIDFAATAGAGGKLYMAGGNGTRTAVSNGAKATLLATTPAWDLQVNE